MHFLRIVLICLGLTSLSARAVTLQTPTESEVRQIVTFSFLPGSTSEAIRIYREEVVPLYENNDAMLSFRAFREIESPIPLDLIAISSFRGMSGMDVSNAALRDIASAAGKSLGAIYGQIGALSSGHTDQFIEMLPSLGLGDPSASRITALVWYQVLPGKTDAFEDALSTALLSADGELSVPSATGRFLLSDGWHYLRFLGFGSLGQYQEYWSGATEHPAHQRIHALTVRRREVIVAAIPGLSVR